MTDESYSPRRSVTLDDEIIEIVENFNQDRKFRNFSLALREIIREWHTAKTEARQFQPVAGRGQLVTTGGQ